MLSDGSKGTQTKRVHLQAGEPHLFPLHPANSELPEPKGSSERTGAYEAVS